MSHNFKQYFEETLRRIEPIQNGETFAEASLMMSLRRAGKSDVWVYTNRGSHQVIEMDAAFNFASPPVIPYDDWCDEIDRLLRHEEVFALKWSANPHFVSLLSNEDEHLEQADLLGVSINYRRNHKDPLEYTHLVLAFFKDRTHSMAQLVTGPTPIVTTSHLPLSEKWCCEWVQDP